jgi:hypothetical protein
MRYLFSMADSEYHDEVVKALTAIDDPELGEVIRKDRGSAARELGSLARRPRVGRRVGNCATPIF